MEADKIIDLTQENVTRFETLFEHYFDRVFQYVFSRTNNRQVAEDITSQIFLNILEALPRYESRRPLAAWVFTIARNTLISHYRFTFRHPIQSLEAVGLLESNPFAAISGNTKDVDHYLDLEKAMNQLTVKDRELLRLKYAAGLSFDEIGDLLGKSPEAIKMAIHRLLRKLEDGMELS
ncbi:MAG: RNA polymerase sigma factor [Anaerolineales bacterium]